MADVFIAGGGVIGLSIAWRARQAGFDVTVADPDPGQGASHAAAGMLTPVSEAAYTEKELFGLGAASLARYPAFAAELTEASGRPTGFRLTGTLQVGYDHDDLAVIDELRELHDSLGVPGQWLTGRECRRLEPMLDPAVRGGLLAEADGSVDPRLLTQALLAAVERAGVRMIRLPVTRIEGRTARLADGTVAEADWVVLAAGWKSAGIDGLPAGAVPPVRPVKGQVLRLRGPAGFLNRSVRGVVRGSSVYLVPREDGELVVGATQEELGEDTRVTAGGLWELLRDARALVPGLTELEFTEAVARLRPGTPDNGPILGPGPADGTSDGLVLATGHFRNGVLLTPVTADAIVGYLTNGRLPEVAAHFTIERFAGGSA
ncbi:MAG TPA: glycine oxidase ThiO [Streptosporangiaceae bacterium]|nr:glycine oxidase ThiO [Streptosporangiaceae bacterium]